MQKITLRRGSSLYWVSPGYYQLFLVIAIALEVIYWFIRDGSILNKLIIELIIVLPLLGGIMLLYSYLSARSNKRNKNKISQQIIVPIKLKIYPYFLIPVIVLLYPIYTINTNYYVLLYIFSYIMIYFFYVYAFLYFIEYKLVENQQSHLKISEIGVCLVINFHFLNIQRAYEYEFFHQKNKVYFILTVVKEGILNTSENQYIFSDFVKFEDITNNNNEFYSIFGIIKKKDQYYAKLVGTLLSGSEVVHVIEQISKGNDLVWVKPSKPIKDNGLDLQPLVLSLAEIKKLA